MIIPGEGGSKHHLVKSLLLLRNLEVDVIICSVSIGETEIVEVTHSEWEDIIDDLLYRLKHR